MQKVENMDETPHDGKPLLCAGADSKDGISLIHRDSLQSRTTPSRMQQKNPVS